MIKLSESLESEYAVEAGSSRPSPAAPRWAPWLAAAGVVLLTLAVFFPARHFGYVSYDDPEYVTGNRHVQAGLTWQGLRWAFTTTWSSYWHPLTWLSHMLDATLFGASPAGPHVVNVLLHAANALILFTVLRAATASVWKSALVAVLFAVHPLHVESVAWVAERKDVLSTFFALLTLGSYVRYCGAYGGARRTWYFVSVGCFAAAAMSKPTVVTLPCVLLLLDYWPLQRLPSESWREVARALIAAVREKIPFFAISAGLSVITIVAQRRNGVMQTLGHFSFGERLENACVSYTRYLASTVWPTRLAVFYPHPGEWPFLTFAVSVAVVALGMLLALSVARRWPAIAVGWFWYVGVLMPTIGLVQVGDQARADRYTYFALIGVFVGAVWFAGELWQQFARWRVPLAVAAAGVVGACVVQTSRQLARWHDNETLFRHALAVTVDNFVAHNNLANALVAKGDLDEAIAHFEKALAIQPEYAPPYNNLGTVFLELGRTDEALALLRKAVEVQPQFAEVRNNFGNALRQKGDLSGATAEYRRAIELRPDLAVAYENLGLVELDQRLMTEAIRDLRTAVAIEPRDGSAHAALGEALLANAQPDEGLAELRHSLTLAPDDPQAHYRLAEALLRTGRPWEAVEHFRSAATQQPDDLDLQNNLGWALLQADQADEAIACFKRILARKPDFALAQTNLALAFRRSGLTSNAVAQYESFLVAHPNHAGVLTDLAWLLATTPDATIRNGARAVELARQATALTRGRDLGALRSLAAALAEAGDFGEAVATAQRALDLVGVDSDSAVAEGVRAQLQRYQAGAPYREPAAKPTTATVPPRTPDHAAIVPLHFFSAS